MSELVICSRENCPFGYICTEIEELDGILLVTRPVQADCFECESLITILKIK